MPKGLSNLVDNGTTMAMGTGNINPNGSFTTLGGNLYHAGAATPGNLNAYAYPGSYMASFTNIKAPQMMTMWDSLHEKVLRMMENVKYVTMKGNYYQSQGAYNPQNWQVQQQTFNQANLSAIAYNQAQSAVAGQQLNATQMHTASLMGGLTTTSANPTPGSVKRAMTALNRVLGSSQN